MGILFIHMGKSFAVKRRRLRAKLIQAIKILKGEIGQNPILAERARLHITARAQPSSTKEQCDFFTLRELLEHATGALIMWLKVPVIKKNMGRQWPEIFPEASV